MKGLVQFIADLRNARARDVEAKRINAELANIRQKFRDPNLNGYNKKKYVCKLIYIYVLGYDVDIGHAESVSLISSSKYSEKQIGYLAISVMLNENDRLLDMVVNSMRKDLESMDELNTSLALNTIATVGGRNIGHALSNDIFKLLISPTSGNFVRKKAALTMLRLYTRDDSIVSRNWPDRIIALLDDPDLGVTTSVVSLITRLARDSPDLYKHAYDKAVRRLEALVFHNGCPQDYVYYNVAAPWLFVKLFKLLQVYGRIDADATNSNGENVMESLQRVIYRVVDVNGTPSNNLQQSNAQNSVLFEAIRTATMTDMDSNLLNHIVEALGQFLEGPENNVRYLSLTALATLATTYDATGVRQYVPTVVALLKDRDISIRRKAIDLLYAVCDANNVDTIVSDLLKNLSVADVTLREELVVRIAVLAERFATEHQWYVDIMLRLVAVAGTHVGDDVWQRIVQIVVNNEALQVYAAKTVLLYLTGKYGTVAAGDSMVNLGGYILGEYGHLVADEPGCSPIEQFLALHDKFPTCSSFTKGLLLTTYIKFVNLFEEIRSQLLQVFEMYSTSLDAELQQRACEYMRLSTGANRDLLATVWDEMPPFPERESALLSKFSLPGASTSGAQQKLPSLNIRASVIFDSRTSSPATSQDPLSLSTPSSITPAFTGASTGSGGTPTNRTPSVGSGIGAAAPRPPPSRKISSNSASNVNLELASSWETGYKRLVVGPSGLLYEDSLINIGVKSEYRRHLGCVILIFRNLSGLPLDSLSVEVTNPIASKLAVSTKNFPSSRLKAGGSTQQVLILDARQPFFEAPTIKVTFMAGTLKRIILKLPVVIDKFMEPTSLTGEEFFTRWNQMGPQREQQKVFKNISASSVEQIIRTFGDDHHLMSKLNWGVIDHIDHNSIVGASIVHTSVAGNFGCLLRLEPDENHFMYRVTVRATDDKVAEALVKTIASIYQL